MSGAEDSTSVQNDVENCTSTDCVVDRETHGQAKMIAPQLRVEELRDDGHSSAASVSDLDETLSDRDDTDRSPQAPAQHEKPFVAPSDELKEKIIKQVEFYFCDANILKDAFLLKHVKRNKLGYVSLKLITSFRKVKSMTKDYRVTAYSLRDSTELEVNEDGTKVRRRTALPDYDETTPSRTIVAMNLPKENPSIEDVAELFSSCGEISLIRVLKPGKTIPPDVKRHLSGHPEVGNATCAVVEFERHESARAACDTMTDLLDWRRGLCVTLLASAREKKKNGKNEKNEKNSHRQHKSSTGESKPVNDSQAEVKLSQSEDDAQANGAHASHGAEKGDCDAGGPKPRKEQRAKKKGRAENAHEQDRDGAVGADGDGSWRDARGPFTRDSLSPQGSKYSPAGSPRSSPRSSPRGSPHFRRRTASHGKSPLAAEGHSPCPSPEPSRRKQGASLEASPSPSGSPWVQRRLKAQMEGNASPLAGSPMGSPRLGRRLLDLEGVIRQPKGPDGSPGFYGGKGRGKPVESV